MSLLKESPIVKKQVWWLPAQWWFLLITGAASVIQSGSVAQQHGSEIQLQGN